MLNRVIYYTTCNTFVLILGPVLVKHSLHSCTRDANNKFKKITPNSIVRKNSRISWLHHLFESSCILLRRPERKKTALCISLFERCRCLRKQLEGTIRKGRDTERNKIEYYLFGMKTRFNAHNGRSFQSGAGSSSTTFPEKHSPVDGSRKREHLFFTIKRPLRKGRKGQLPCHDG